MTQDRRKELRELASLYHGAAPYPLPLFALVTEALDALDAAEQLVVDTAKALQWEMDDKRLALHERDAARNLVNELERELDQLRIENRALRMGSGE